jgi:hypothetical protein
MSDDDNEPGIITKKMTKGEEKANIALLTVGLFGGMYFGGQVGGDHRNARVREAESQYRHANPEPREPLLAIDMQKITADALTAAAQAPLVASKGVGKIILDQIIEEYYVVWQQLPSDGSPQQNSIRKQRAFFDAANLDAARKSGITQDILEQVIDTFEAKTAELKQNQKQAIALEKSDYQKTEDKWHGEKDIAMNSAEMEIGTEFAAEAKGAAIGSAIGLGGSIALALGTFFLARRRARQQSAAVAR